MNNDLERARQSFYNTICSDCEEFYKEIREEIEDQGEIEVFFLPLWRRLSMLFLSQEWDYGEFRKMSWDESKKMLDDRRNRK